MSALTAPYDPTWSARLGAALGIVGNVAVLTESAAISLSVISGSITWDEDQMPHVTAAFTCRIPDSQDVLDALDPRLNRRLILAMGYQVPGETETQMVADLMLTERIVKRGDNGAAMEIRAVSDEQKMLDTRPITGSRTYTETSDGGQAIRDLILWAVPGATVQVTATGTFVAAGDTLVIDREDELGSAIQDIADRIGAWVYHDGLGTFRVVPQPVNAGAATAMFQVDTGGTITGSEAALTREKFANTVAVTYSWYDGDQRTAFGYAEVVSGPYAVATVGRKVINVQIERKGTAAQAKAAATQMVSRAITRGRSLSIEYDHAPLWVRPGQTVTVQLPTGPQERHLVSRVDIDIPSGHGHLTTRQPENVTITTGE